MRCKELNLRALEPEDLDLLYEWENDESHWLVSNTLVPFSRHTLRQYLENAGKTIYETGQLRLMIELVESRTTIGTIDIFDFDHFNERAGIGILIASEEHRRKGYASMALKCLTTYCFSRLMLHQVYCNILATNNESIALFTSAGFMLCGTKKEWARTNDGYIDEQMYQLVNGSVSHPT
jgi:diamine N-acetyltransferase